MALTAIMRCCSQKTDGPFTCHQANRKLSVIVRRALQRSGYYHLDQQKEMEGWCKLLDQVVLKYIFKKKKIIFLLLNNIF